MVGTIKFHVMSESDKEKTGQNDAQTCNQIWVIWSTAECITH